jgi:hypothetical protein
MNKQSFNLALQLYTSFLEIKEPLTKAFHDQFGFRKDFDLTPYYNRYVQISYSHKHKHYTFIFFPFRIFTPSIIDTTNQFTSFQASEVYAFEKNDNVDFCCITPSGYQMVNTRSLNFPYFNFKDNSYAFHTHTFYDKVSHDSLKFLSTLLESINENSITDWTGSFKYVPFLKNVVASALLMLS